MGQGPTLGAAKAMNRKVVGMDVDEAHCEIAVKRLAQEVMDFTPTGAAS